MEIWILRYTCMQIAFMGILFVFEAVRMKDLGDGAVDDWYRSRDQQRAIYSHVGLLGPIRGQERAAQGSSALGYHWLLCFGIPDYFMPNRPAVFHLRHSPVDSDAAVAGIMPAIAVKAHGEKQQEASSGSIEPSVRWDSF